MRRKHLTEFENLNLPIPRLEIRYRPAKKSEEGNLVADYSMIYEHLDGSVFAVPMGKTVILASSRRDPLELPFRDGAHILHDMWHLKLRAFVINGSKYEELEVTKDTVSSYQHRKMLGDKLTKFKPEKNNQESTS